MIELRRVNPFFYFRRTLIILLCTCVLFFSIPMPEAKAMDPVTIGILAPILLPYAVQLADYTLKGLIKTIPGWVNIGTQFFNILRLPLGLVQISLGFPFGLFGLGVNNIVQGVSAPFMVMKGIIQLPMYFIGG